MITANQYLRQKFNKKIYKLSLDAGFTCPTRDGSLGTKGCIFCSGRGSGDFAEDPALSVTEQLREAKKRVAAKNPEGYIAYFQAFTNTYASVEKLRSLYDEALADPEVVGISIATRPDCLSDDIVELIGSYAKKTEVWTELGLQTIKPESVRYIRRGYPNEVYEAAVSKLKAAGVQQVITHVILGLPGETTEDMLKTVDYVVNSGADGIKLQLLHVLKGTDLAEDYLAGKFKTLEFEEYTKLVAEAVKRLPQGFVVHRLTGDGAGKDLIAPLWSLDKKKVLNEINRLLRENDCTCRTI